MNCASIIKAEIRSLQRIIALLCALADLADRAGQRSWPICTLVLWFLRPAECAATSHIATVTGDATWLEPFQPDPSDPVVQAIHLASRFRLLAATLAVCLTDALVLNAPLILPPRRTTALRRALSARAMMPSIERRDSS